MSTDSKSKATRTRAKAKPAGAASAPALAPEDCGLKLFLQPIYMPAAHEVFGYECLLRIVDMELGTLSPGVFLDVAEKSPELLVKMENWAIEEICDMQEKMASGSKPDPAMLSLNISSAHFFSPDFLPTVKRITKNTKAHLPSICLEFKEEVLFEQKDYVEKTFAALRELGLKIAIDDFGIEFFSVFRDSVPAIDIVKIDRSYTSNFLTNSKSATIVRAVIDYAKENNLQVVAVGVEKEDQQNGLLELGCGKMQGYLYSKPLVKAKPIRKRTTKNK